MPRSLQSLIGYPKKEKSLWKIQALAGVQSQPPHTAPLITFSMERRRSWLIRSRVILPAFQRTRKFGRRLMLSHFRTHPACKRSLRCVADMPRTNSAGQSSAVSPSISSSVLGSTPSHIDALTLMQALHVYEVDHPATQSWKRARLKELGIKSPRTLHHIPIDFEHETLTSGLAAGGVNCNVKAFFSCLGVTQYLTRDVVLNTLREIASATAPGSELVVQFIVPAATLSREEGNLVTAAAGRAASMGEPWLSFFAPDDLETNMTQIGFDQIEHFGSEEATERYLLDRTDGLTLPGFFRMIKARVA
jgi:hypothetical protein